MYLSEVKLWNFRKFGSKKNTLDLNKPDLMIFLAKGLNVLIGENDSGKTAIIDAIKLVLDTHSSEWVKLTQEDFYKSTSRLRIECRFKGFSDEEAMHFTEWLGMDGEGENAKPYLKVILDASKKDDKILLFDISAGADDEGHRLPAEARYYLKTIYLKPLRDAKSELIPRRNSRLSQILSGHDVFKSKDEGHILENISRCLNCLFQKYFKKDYKESKCTFKEIDCPFKDFIEEESPGKQLQGNIQATINWFFGNDEYTANFVVIDRKLKNILEQLKLSLSNEELGLGSHNLLFIAAELMNLQKEHWSGLRLALIEELEAHLEPQRQMRMVEYFEEITSKSNGKDIQIILTTHSPNLASKVKLENLIICHNGKVFPMGTDYTELVKTDYIFLERFLDVTKANLFFAKGVILVEGWTEELILPVLAKKIGWDLTQKGVSIVNVGSTAFLRYAKIFQRKDGSQMSIPIAIITDIDVKEYEKKAKLESDKKVLKDKEGKVIYEYLERDKDEISTESNNKKQKLEKKFKNTKACIAPHWTLEYSLYKSTSLSKQFQEVAKSVHPQIELDGSFEKGLASKLINKSLNKTDIAYKLAQLIEQDCKKEHPDITIEEGDNAIRYLIDAIKHVTK